MHFQMSSDKNISWNAFDKDLNQDLEIDQLFEDTQKVKGTKEVTKDPEIELLFGDESEVGERESVRNAQPGNEEIVRPLPAHEVENR